MNLLDSLLENMRVRSRGASSDRLSFLADVMDQPSNRMISKSLSKIGKSREVLEKEREKGIKAVYKLSMLLNKKLRTIRLHFFVKLEEHSKASQREKSPAPKKQQSQADVEEDLERADTVKIDLPKQNAVSSTYNILQKMCEQLDILHKKYYCRQSMIEGLDRIRQVSNRCSRFKQGANSLSHIMNSNKHCSTSLAFQFLKDICKQVDRIELFTRILSSSTNKYNNLILRDSFEYIIQHAQYLKQISDSKSKQLTQQSSLLSLKSSVEPLNQRQVPQLEFKLYRNELVEIQSQKESNEKPCKMIRELKETKCPSISFIEPQLEVNETNYTNIFMQKQKALAPKQPLKLDCCSGPIQYPKQEDRYYFFFKPKQNIPKQVNRLHPDEKTLEIHDIAQPLGLFDRVPKSPFRESNIDYSKNRYHKELKLGKKNTKVICLKNSFTESKRFECLPFTPKKECKLVNLSDSRKSAGLKSSRRIKQSCVGQWQPLGTNKFIKTECFSPAKEPQTKAILTTRPKCINSITIARAEALSRQKYENRRTESIVKKAPSLYSEFLHRLRGS